MQRAVAFCQVIEISTGAKTHKVSSKQIAGMFQLSLMHIRSQKKPPTNTISLRSGACRRQHERQPRKKQSLIGSRPSPRPIPAAYLVTCVASPKVSTCPLWMQCCFLPRAIPGRRSAVVGRVMRIAPGKKRGYIILPVVIRPAWSRTKR